MKRAIATGSAVVLLIAVTAAVALPLLALQGLRDALTVRNGDSLTQWVDADRLRTNLAARIRARYETASTGLRMPIEPIVERLLTPGGLIAAICDGGALTVDGRVPSSCEISGALSDVRFESASRFSAALSRQGTVAATIVMDRAGLHWRLVDLVLPPTAYDQFKDSVLN